MDRFVFERELDSYISKRRTRSRSFSFSFLKGWFAQKPKPVEVSKEEPVPQTVKLSSPAVVPVSEDDKDTASIEYETDKKGVFSKVFEWIMASSPEQHDASVSADLPSVLAEKDMHNDLREIARISIATFRHLPVHKIRSFKESPDYVTFKNILKKHGLARD